jgi:hypothetical protein
MTLYYTDDVQAAWHLYFTSVFYNTGRSIAVTNYRTEENISMITTSTVNVIIVSFFISFILTCLYFLIFIFFRLTINPGVLITGIAMFGVYFISNLFIRTEYFLAVKNDYRIRPPLQILIISVAAYIVLFLIIHDRFMEIQRI